MTAVPYDRNEDLSDESTTVTILGREVGTSTGWDGDHESVIFYNFAPKKGCTIPAGDITINFTLGTATLYDDQGGAVESVDLIDTLETLSRV